MNFQILKKFLSFHWPCLIMQWLSANSFCNLFGFHCDFFEEMVPIKIACFLFSLTPRCFRLESYSCKMVSTDKKEWKRSFQNTEKTNSLTDTNGVPAKKPYGGKELHPLSPSEDFLISSGYLSTSPIFSTVQFNNGRQIATASRRLRHVSEPTSGGSASSDNDTSDHDNSLGRAHTILVGAVSKRTLFVSCFYLTSHYYRNTKFAQNLVDSFC